MLLYLFDETPMKMTGNTILITGGTSGIGFELARQLCQDNTVIITGRAQDRLDVAQSKLGNVYTMPSDVSDPASIATLRESISLEFPALNVLVNNAGIMRKISLHDASSDLTDITREVETNLCGPIRMTQQFIPHLKTQSSSAIVNVSSGLAFVPFPISPIYSATKAALHSFTLALRVQMKETNIKLFELAPPATETPLFRGDFDETDLGAMKGMDVTKLVSSALKAMGNDVLEIRPGLSNVLKLMSRIAPNFALNMLARELAKSLDRMRTEARAL
jgi:uncharacterized oxidoreductase